MRWRHAVSRSLNRRGGATDTVFAYVLNAPALLLVCALIGYPLVYSFVLSLQRYNVRRPNDTAFIGFANYRSILQSGEFWHALGVTLVFVLLSVALILTGGLFLALLANESFRGRGLVRSLLLLPWAIPPVVNGLLWQWILNSRVGALNGLLYDLGIIDSYRTWLLNPSLAILMIIVAHVWKSLPFTSIVLLAGLQAIPAELYDAAKVDRAGTLQRFWHVTLPWLLHPVLIAMIFETMMGFKAFDIFYVLTGGGPGDATTVLAWLTYQTAFKFLDFGLGNAYGFVLALLTLGLAVLYIRALYSRGEFRV